LLSKRSAAEHGVVDSAERVVRIRNEGFGIQVEGAMISPVVG